MSYRKRNKIDMTTPYKWREVEGVLHPPIADWGTMPRSQLMWLIENREWCLRKADRVLHRRRLSVMLSPVALLLGFAVGWIL